MGKKMIRRLLNRRQWLLGAIATAGFIFGITSTARGEGSGEKAGEGGRVSDRAADGGAVAGHVTKEGSAIEGLTVRIFRKADKQQSAHGRVHAMGERHGGSSSAATGRGENAGAGKREHEGDARRFEAVTDAAGAFHFSDLPAGKWAVLCESGGGYRAWKVITVSAGQESAADLNLEKSKPAPERGRSTSSNGGGHGYGEHPSSASARK